MQKLTKISAIIFMIMASLLFAACGTTEENTTTDVLVTSITLNVPQITVLNGDSYPFEVTVLPANATNKAVLFNVQNTSVGTIDSAGIFTAIGNGSTRVVVQSLDGSSKFATADITVLSAPIQLTIPQDFTLNLENNELSWSSVSDAQSYIVSIDNSPQTPTSLTTFPITGYNTTHTYKVKAAGDEHTILNSSDSATITAKIMATPSNFSNTEDTFSWNAVTGAISYEVWVNGAVADNGTSTSIVLDLSAAQTYEVKVRAMIDEANAYSSQYTDSIIITRLAIPASVGYLPNGIHWNAVAEADYYIVTINEEEYSTTKTYYNLPTSAEAIEYTFVVQACSDETGILESANSLEYTLTKLNTPTNLRVQDGKVMWDAVLNAQSYSLELNEEVIQIIGTEFEISDNYNSGLYSIRIMSNGDGANYLNSNYTSMLQTTKLSYSMQVGVVNGVVTWLPVLHATRYVLNFNGTEYTTSNTYFSADELVAGSYEVRIRAEAENYIYSTFSSVLSVTKLATPTNLKMGNGLIRWDSVAHISSYEIIAGATILNSGVLNGYYLRLPGDNSYDVKVRSIGDNSKYLNSAYTDVLLVTKLATPADLTLENGYVHMTPVDNANDYVLEINGTPYIVREDMFPYYLNESPNEIYQVRLLARGDSTYLNSEYSSILSATQLPAVENIRIQNSHISWDIIEGVAEYEIWIKDISAETYNIATDLYLTDVNTFDLTSISSGSYTVKVRPRGDSNSYFVGNESEEINFEKLAIPTAFRLQRGFLVWNAISNATSYLLEVDDGTTVTEEFTYDSMYVLDDSYDLGTYSIRVCAYGDGLNYITSDFTTSIVGDRMTQPQNVRVVDGAPEWDPVPNATSYTVFVDGISFYADAVYLPEGMELPVRFEDTDPYPAGNYLFKLYAGREGYFASKMSTPINIQKLPTPSHLRVEDGIIKWDAVLSGTGYRLIIDDVIIETNELSYDFEDYMYYGPANFTISIVTVGDMGDDSENVSDNIGNKVNSDYASAIPLTVMNSPASLQVKQGLINWSPVEGAVDYEIRVYEKVSEGVYNLLSIDNPLLTGNVSEYLLGLNYPAGEYAVDIRAIGDGSRYITSEFSEKIDVIKLDAPTGLAVVNGIITYDRVYRIFEVEGQDPIIQEVYEYEVLANDVYVSAGMLNTYELEEQFLAGNYDVAVRAVGDDIIYLTSNPCTSIAVYKLDFVENFRVESGILKWMPNADATKYILNIAYIDMEIEPVVEELGLITSYEIPNTIAQGNYQITIKAKGNNSDLLNSNASNVLTVYKMDAVENLRVDSGVITWNPVYAPDGYTFIVINATTLIQSKITLSSTAFSYSLPSQFTAGNYLIYVQTNGDDSTHLSSIKVGNADTSSGFEVTKLQIPTTIALSLEDETFYLNWTAVANTTQYRVFVDENSYIVNGTQYNITNLDLAVGQHSASVQAVGNTSDGISINYVNSDYHTPITMVQPSEPTELKIENGMVSWVASDFATEYQINIKYNGVQQPLFTVSNTYYYLTNLGNYEVGVKASYSGSLASAEVFAEPYTFDLFNTGNGSQASPFEVSDATQLNYVKYNPTAYYVLTDNIVLGSTNFTPIGTQEMPFMGNFNGAFKTISGLTINSTYTYAGLFGYVGTTGSIYNFNLMNVNLISASQYTGAVAGYNMGNIDYITISGNVKPVLNDANTVLYAGGAVGYNIGTIHRIKNQTAVLPSNDSNLVYGGGIAGYNNGLIETSGTEASATVKATLSGGITGYNNGNIIQTYNKGTITAEAKSGATGANGYAGGIAGYNYNSDSVSGYTGLIRNSYNRGAVTATSDTIDIAYAGGIAGYNKYYTATYYGEIQYTYSIGIITATNSYPGGSSYAGGIAGYNQSGLKLTYSHFLSTSAVYLTNGVDGGAETASQTETYLKSSAFASAFNTYIGSTIWNSVDSFTYAILVWESSY